MGISSNPIPSVDAYVVVPVEEEQQQQQENPAHIANNGTAAATAMATTIDINQPAVSVVSQEFASIPETQDLSWQDDFFDDGFDDIVAVFDFDHEAMEHYYKCLSWSCLGFSSCCWPSIIPLLLVSCVPCFVNKNVNWSVRSQHVALTRTGVLFVHDKRPVGWGASFCSVDKKTRFIPYKEIRLCTVADGNCMPCSVSNHLRKVLIDGQKGDVEITGLKNPLGFQKLAVALIKNQGSTKTLTAASAHRLSVVMEDRDVIAASANNDDVAVVLCEIRDELREQNNALRAVTQPVPVPVVVQPSAPPSQEK